MAGTKYILPNKEGNINYIGAKFIIVNEEENFNIIMSMVLECNLKCSSGMFGHMTILHTIT